MSMQCLCVCLCVYGCVWTAVLGNPEPVTILSSFSVWFVTHSRSMPELKVYWIYVLRVHVLSPLPLSFAAVASAHIQIWATPPYLITSSTHTNKHRYTHTYTRNVCKHITYGASSTSHPFRYRAVYMLLDFRALDMLKRMVLRLPRLKSGTTNSCRGCIWVENVFTLLCA